MQKNFNVLVGMTIKQQICYIRRMNNYITLKLKQRRNTNHRNEVEEGKTNRKRRIKEVEKRDLKI